MRTLWICESPKTVCYIPTWIRSLISDIQRNCDVIFVASLANIFVSWNTSVSTSLQIKELQPFNRFSCSMIIETLSEIFTHASLVKICSNTGHLKISRKQNVSATDHLVSRMLLQGNLICCIIVDVSDDSSINEPESGVLLLRMHHLYTRSRGWMFDVVSTETLI
jgi:hypothetical protein